MTYERTKSPSITFGPDPYSGNTINLGVRPAGDFTLQQVHDTVENEHKVLVRRYGRSIALVINFAANEQACSEFYTVAVQQDIEEILQTKDKIFKIGT